MSFTPKSLIYNWQITSYRMAFNSRQDKNKYQNHTIYSKNALITQYHANSFFLVCFHSPIHLLLQDQNLPYLFCHLHSVKQSHAHMRKWTFGYTMNTVMVLPSGEKCTHIRHPGQQQKHTHTCMPTLALYCMNIIFYKRVNISIAY